jgi:hypothetical protein
VNVAELALPRRAALPIQLEGVIVGTFVGTREGRPVRCGFTPGLNVGVSVGPIVGTFEGEGVGIPNLHGTVPVTIQYGEASNPGRVQRKFPSVPPHLEQLLEQHPFAVASTLPLMDTHHLPSNFFQGRPG